MSRLSSIVVGLLVAFLLSGIRTRCMAEEKPKPANAEPSKKPLSTEDLRRAAEKDLAKHDKDGDGRLTLDEFLAAAAGDERGQKRRRFFEWDADENQQLDLDELAQKGLGARLTAVNDYRRRDGDDDAQISLQEFLACEAEKSHPQVKRLFGVLDFDGSGSLSRDEFLAWPGRLPIEKRPRVPDPLADARQAAFESWKTLFASADANVDGTLSEPEWPAHEFATAPPGLAEIPFDSWDHNRNGRVDEAEGRRLFDLAYGFIRPDGNPLRGPGGDVLNWAAIRGLDANGDARLSREEFVPRFRLGKEKSEELFNESDADGDGQLDDEECKPIFALDILSQFLTLDADFDGHLAHEELVKAFGGWVPSIVDRILPAFDADGDGRLSFYEFRATPYANWVTNWVRRLVDTDHDGRLSWKEYYFETPPVLAGLSRHFFYRFDLNKDGFLSLDEWDFGVDFTKIPPEVVIRLNDHDEDGKLRFAELFSEKKPDQGGDAAAVYARRITEAQDRFRACDGDGDEALDPNELAVWQRAESEAARREAQEIARAHSAKQFAGLDKDGDRHLTIEEFLADALGGARTQQRQQFFAWDADENEKLNLDEYLERGQGLPLSAVNDFRLRDTSGDGQVSLPEFLAWESEKSHPRAKRLFMVLDFDASETLDREEFLVWPGRLPIEKRPTVPDPLADAKRNAFDAWKTLFDDADRDRDGAWTAGEWPAAKMAAALPALAGLPFANWDRDGNGRVDEAEGQWLLDLAFGFRRPNDRPLRGPSGDVLNWASIRGLDVNRDGQLSAEEFVPRFRGGNEKNSALFKEHDADQDGQLSDAEFEPIFGLDILGQFFSVDTDLDAHISHDELLKAFGSWVPSIVERIMPAFDVDGDGQLSLYEFRMLPYTNPVTDWNRRRVDADHDGRLSWKEYDPETPPLLAGLNRHFFDHFDLDDDGYLSLDEWEFSVDFTKMQPELAFRIWDRNGDGKLQFAELFSDKKPDGDVAAIDVYGRRFAEARERFGVCDADADQVLDVREAVVWHQEVTKAALREAEKQARRQTTKQFSELDKNGDKQLSRDEFLSGAAGDVRGQKHRQFFTWDADENQKLSLDELLRRGQGAALSVLNDFRRRDENGDGQLSLEELLSCEGEKGHPNAKRLFEVLDFDKSAALSGDEFRAWPGRTPIDERPKVPDPLADIRQTALEKWRALLAAADGDRDRSLTQREWPAAKIAAAIPALGEVAFKMWDRDGNGGVDEAEGRWLFDLAYGFIRPDGEPLRGQGGDVLNWVSIRGLDANRDGRLSREEFVPRFRGGHATNGQLFDRQDADGDGQLSDAESRPVFSLDIVSHFLAVDSDLDAHVGHDELIKTFGSWIPNIVERILPAFDADGDGGLSFYEFRVLPYTNSATNWAARRTDSDHDGRLSWKEYYLEAPPLLAGLNRHFFDHFDLNKDGYLSLNEWDFNIDFTKAPPEISFRAKDTDGDGKLTFAEVFAERKPTDGDLRAMDRYEMRLAHAENRFLSDDKDGNRYLDLDELIQSQQSAMQAARRHSKVLSRRKSTLEGNYWVRKGVLVVNEIAFIAGVIFVLRRKRAG